MVGARRGPGIDGARPRRQDQVDADEGRGEGRRPEMDRRESRRTDRAEELKRRARITAMELRLPQRCRLRRHDRRVKCTVT